MAFFWGSRLWAPEPVRVELFVALGPLFSDALSHVEAGELTLGQAPLPLFLWEPCFSVPSCSWFPRTNSQHPSPRSSVVHGVFQESRAGGRVTPTWSGQSPVWCEIDAPRKPRLFLYSPYTSLIYLKSWSWNNRVWRDGPEL